MSNEPLVFVTPVIGARIFDDGTAWVFSKGLDNETEILAVLLRQLRRIGIHSELKKWLLYCDDSQFWVDKIEWGGH